MVFHGSNQSHQGDQEQEDAHRNDHADYAETGNQPEANAPGSNSNQQQANQGVEQVERAQAVLGTREAPANHIGACGSRQLQVNLAPAEPRRQPLCPRVWAWPKPGRNADASGEPGATAALRGNPGAAPTRSGTCGRRSGSRSLSPAQPPRLARRADWPPARNKGRNMQITARCHPGSGRGGKGRGGEGRPRGEGEGAEAFGERARGQSV